MMLETHIEITRSFTKKINLGNYQSADFFMSSKASCLSSNVRETAQELYELCRNEVERSIEAYLNPEPPPSQENVERRIAEAEATLAANGEIATGPVVVEVQKPQEGPTTTTVSTPSPEAPKGGSDQLERFKAVAGRLAQVSQRDPKAIKENVIVPFVHAFIRNPERKRWMKAPREEYEVPLRFLESLCKSAGLAMKVVQEPAAMGDRLQVGYNAVQRAFSATPELQEAAEECAVRCYPEDGGAALCEWKMSLEDRSTSELMSGIQAIKTNMDLGMRAVKDKIKGTNQG